MYLYNTDDQLPEHYKTLKFTQIRRKESVTLEISSYIDELSLYRLTENSARDSLKNVKFRLDDFNVTYNTRTVRNSIWSYDNFIVITFVEKNPRKPAPVKLEFTYNLKHMFAITKEHLESCVVKLTGNLLAMLYYKSDVELLS